MLSAVRSDCVARGTVEEEMGTVVAAFVDVAGRGKDAVRGFVVSAAKEASSPATPRTRDVSDLLTAPVSKFAGGFWRENVIVDSCSFRCFGLESNRGIDNVAPPKFAGLSANVIVDVGSLRCCRTTNGRFVSSKVFSSKLANTCVPGRVVSLFLKQLIQENSNSQTKKI
jgi:hypothetical protein